MDAVTGFPEEHDVGSTPAGKRRWLIANGAFTIGCWALLWYISSTVALCSVSPASLEGNTFTGGSESLADICSVLAWTGLVIATLVSIAMVLPLAGRWRKIQILGGKMTALAVWPLTLLVLIAAFQFDPSTHPCMF